MSQLRPIVKMSIFGQIIYFPKLSQSIYLYKALKINFFLSKVIFCYSIQFESKLK